MNAVTTTQPRPQIVAGGSVAALVPQSLDEAFRVSQAIAASGLAPRGLEKPEQIMVAIMAGAELGFAPFQSLQSFAVVNGRPTLWGDGLVAVVRRNGCTIREWHEDDTAFCEVKRPDTGETILRSFSQADAVKAGLSGKTGPWQQYPQRMRAMRARAWAVRDGCADKGLRCAEGRGGRHPNARRTQFKKGATPHTYRGAGHERIDSKGGYVVMIVEELNPWSGAKTRPVHKHRWLWEQANGPIPDGFCLKCQDGDKLNTDPSNWTLIERGVLPHLNGGRFKKRLAYDEASPELKPALMAAAKIKHALHKRRKDAA